MRHGSVREIRALLDARGVSLKKRWGQNFLVNAGARRSIVEALAPAPGDVVWEIGGGLGAITELLVDRVRLLAVFEIDHGLAEILGELYGSPECTVVDGDFCRTWRTLGGEAARPSKVVGNLPYSCASRIVATLAEAPIAPSVLVLTVQRELAQRMRASAGDPDYSSFSVLCGVAFEMREHSVLSGASFYPAPRVASSVLVLRPRRAGVEMPALSGLCRAFFASRRKTIRNNVLAAPELAPRAAEIFAALEQMGHTPADRPEQLCVAEYLELSRRVYPPAD